MRFRFLITLLAVTLAAAASASGETTIPQGGGANNVVLAQTTADGSLLVRANTQVSQAGGNTVTSSNIATAQATGCSGCDSTAVAVQVVFVTGSPQYFAPSNAAVAVNGGCTGCGSFAYAWQYLVQTGAPVALTPDARQQVQTLKQEIADTAAAIVPDSLEADMRLQSELDSLTSQLKDLIDSQTRLLGVDARGTVFERVDQRPVS
jgi:Fe-S cluster biogenesis protein NfuA